MQPGSLFLVFVTHSEAGRSGGGGLAGLSGVVSATEGNAVGEGILVQLGTSTQPIRNY